MSSSASASGSRSGNPSPQKPRPPPLLSPAAVASSRHHHQHHHPSRSPSRAPSPLLTPSAPPLSLTVRFSTSIPDLELDIPHPRTTTVVALKHLIRSRLAAADSARRLRFIHGGRILSDTAVLSSVLPIIPPPPPPSPSPGGGGGSGSSSSSPSKGKQREGAPPGAPQRIYINCSIGDVLSRADLDAEATAASGPAPGSEGGSGDDIGGAGGAASDGVRRRGGGGGAGTPAATTTPRPRGFDRLAAAGFSAAEVNALRLQFASIQATRHTPDSMPSPDGLRRLEDEWLDSNGSGTGYGFSGGGSDGGGGGGGGAEGGGGGGGGGDEFGVAGLLDVLVKGMMIGFLWPAGSLWLLREEGLFSRKWQVFVMFGFVLTFLIGMVKSLSGD